MGIDFVFRELQINRMDLKGISPLKFARRMLEGFKRALYINIKFDHDENDLEERACQIAEDLGLRLERTNGSIALLKDVIDRALTLSGNRGSC